MPPVASSTLLSRPGFFRHLLLSNRIPARGRTWKGYFTDVPTEPPKSKTPSGSPTKVSSPSAPRFSPIPEDELKDPIPSVEEVRKNVGTQDMMDLLSNGPQWNGNMIPGKNFRVFSFGDPNDEEGRKYFKRTRRSLEKQEAHVKRKIRLLERRLGLDKDEQHYQRASYADLEPWAKEQYLEMTGKSKEEMDGDEVLMPVQDSHASALRGLNECLVKAAKNPRDLVNAKDLWRYYCRCKWRIPMFLENVTDRVWQLLWRTQDIDSLQNCKRFEHLKVLNADMISIGKQVSPEQEARRVEAVFKSGQEGDALFKWEQWYEDTISNDKVPPPQAMELGIRMHSHVNNLDRAEKLKQIYFKSYPKANPRIIMSLIDAFIRNKDDFAQRQALLHYIDMKQRLGNSITMADYDSVSLIFFRAQMPHLALIVFTDLMNSPSSPFHGPDLDRRAINRVQELIQLSTTVTSANATSLSLTGILPQRLQNKFFFGSWLKKLIALRQYEAAGQVIELMFQKAITPAPVHLNGLCTALFRSKDKNYQKRAETLLWAMVRQRVELVEQRRKDRDEGYVRPELPFKIKLDGTGAIIPEHVERSIPAATTETFGVLAQHYRLVGKAVHVPNLNKLMQQLDLPMSPFFLTHYLYAKMSLMTDYRNIWVMFRDITTWYQPSSATYEAMWKSLLYRIEKSRFKAGALTPQELFSHMRAWWQGMTDDQRRQASRNWDGRKYNLVLHIFLRLRDLPGAIVAMHAMKNMFGTYPEGHTVKDIVQSLAMLSFKAPTSKVQRLRITLSESYNDNVQATFVVLQALYEDATGKEFVPRFKDGRIPDNNYGNPEQLLKLLTQLTWAFATRTMDEDTLKKAVWVAKNNMGVDDLTIGNIGSLSID